MRLSTALMAVLLLGIGSMLVLGMVPRALAGWMPASPLGGRMLGLAIAATGIVLLGRRRGRVRYVLD